MVAKHAALGLIFACLLIFHAHGTKTTLVRSHSHNKDVSDSVSKDSSISSHIDLAGMFNGKVPVHIKTDKDMDRKELEQALGLINVDFIGIGSFGKVYKAEAPGIGLVAMKIVENNTSKHEKENIPHFPSHKNIAKIGLVYSTPSMDIFFMEYVESIPFRKLDVSSEGVVSLGRQLLEGVQAMHEAGLSHGDLKMDNVLITRGDDGLVVKIIDALGGHYFGDSSPFVEPKCRPTTQLAVAFSPPECILNEGYSHIDVDMFESAMVLVSIFTGRFTYAFESATDYKNAVTCPLFSRTNPEWLANLSMELINFICEMIRPEAKDRLHYKASVWSHSLFTGKHLPRYETLPYSPEPWIAKLQIPQYTNQPNIIDVMGKYQVDLDDLLAPVLYLSREEIGSLGGSPESNSCSSMLAGLGLEHEDMLDVEGTQYQSGNLKNTPVDIVRMDKEGISQELLETFKNFPRERGLLSPSLVLEGIQVMCFVTSKNPKSLQFPAFNDVTLLEALANSWKSSEIALYLSESVQNIVRGLASLSERGISLNEIRSDQIYFGNPGGLIQIDPSAVRVDGMSEDVHLAAVASNVMISQAFSAFDSSGAPVFDVSYCCLPSDLDNLARTVSPAFQDFICRSKDKNIASFEKALNHPFMVNAMWYGEGWIPNVVYDLDFGPIKPPRKAFASTKPNV